VETRNDRDRPTAAVLEGLGQVFATFDAGTQDSGNVSYGVVDADGHRWFVKTAGDPSESPGGTSRGQRVAALRRTASLHRDVHHPVLARLHAVVEAADGPLLVHEWLDGELLRSQAGRRNEPTEAFSRFRALPLSKLVDALGPVIDLHVALERSGWIAGDFYDGSLIYDFDSGRTNVIDLESYHRGAFVNETGRLTGSTRFMAPEEHTRGALVDARTTVFNLGRMLAVLVVERHRCEALLELTQRATHADPARRPQSVAELQRLWLAAVAGLTPPAGSPRTL
jgi:serine/threonine-protein kinase